MTPVWARIKLDQPLGMNHSHLGVFHVIDGLELFIESRALRSRPRVFNVIDSLEVFITSKAFNTRPREANVINSCELFIASKALNS